MIWARQLRRFSWIVLAILIPGGWCSPLGAAPYSGGDGTSETPYLLSTAEDLATLANTQADWGKWFLLTGDVDLRSTAPAQPIGSRPAPFTGVFDGGRHSIRNLAANDTALTSRPFGLFGSVGLPAVIERLRLIAPSIEIAGNGSTGALAGEVARGATIQQCGVEGGTVSAPASDATGGLVGDNGGTVRECFSTAGVTAYGLAGTLLGRNTGLVENGTAAGPTPTLTFPAGTHTVVLTVSDGIESAQDKIQTTVVPPLTGARAAASPTTVGRASTIKDVEFLLLLPAGKRVSDVDFQTPRYVDMSGTRIPVTRDSTYNHKKYTVVASTERSKVISAAGATNGPRTVTMSLRLKTGETVCGAIRLEIVPGFGPAVLTVLTERTAYYYDTETWK